MLQKLPPGLNNPSPDSRPEYVIGVIERPSLLKITPPAQYPQTTPAIPPTTPVIPAPASPPRSLPSVQLPRVPSVAPPSGVQRRADINQELVERINELYRQVHETSPTNSPPTAVWTSIAVRFCGIILRHNANDATFYLTVVQHSLLFT